MYAFVIGKICSGKSSFCRSLVQSGFQYIDLDWFSDIALNSEKVKAELVKLQIDGLMKSDGTVNKAVLSDFIFSNKKNTLIANHIIHPKIYDLLLDKIKEIEELDPLGSFDFVIEYSGYSGLFPVQKDLFLQKSDTVIAIREDYKTRKQRALCRGMTQYQFDRIDAIQPSEKEYRKVANTVIETDDDSTQKFKMVLDFK